MKQHVMVALGEVGVKEDTGRKNRGPRVDEYIRAGGLDPDSPSAPPGGYAWCCGFIVWCLDRARVWSPVTCSVERWAQGAQDNGWTKHIEAQEGDVAIHLDPKGNHCGIVESVDAVSTCEGNTSSEGSREGNCVAIHERPEGYWDFYLRQP